jgi:triacylglycerol lipase
MPRVKALILAVLLAVLLAGGGSAIAYADIPDEAPAIFLPTAPTDPFYSAAGLNIDELTNGTVLKTRQLGDVPGIVVPHEVTQLLVRSTDSKDRPIAAVTTVVVPESPWEGSGPRPLVSEQLPINSLGAGCNPSVKFMNGQFLPDELPPIMQQMLHEGYAVSIPDHLGPRNAYAAGRVAGHVVDDTALGALTLPDSGLSGDSPVAFTGYSGGAIATGWAAGLAPAYAPLLNVVGASVGGTPSDFALLPDTMDKNVAVGLLASAAVGLIREYPELGGLVNMDLANVVLPFFKDQCQDVNIAAGALVGALGLGLENFSTTNNLYDNPLVQKIMELNRMGQTTPLAPVLAVHGEREQWIPFKGAEDLRDEMCHKGVNWQLATFPGEHLLTGAESIPEVVQWLTDRLNGVLAEDGCLK